ncbi:MAG TPA: FHA domain-containing protein, partial [Gaiellaceae bacterium]|nr:FHA domain-containing protein [Gaiellaceae bacterium]
MTNVDIEVALLALKIAFLVLLYLFIWRIVRSASVDFRSGRSVAQESQIIAPGQAAAAGLTPRAAARLVVVKSNSLDRGEEIVVDSLPVTVGRGGQNDVPLEGDDYASAQHARLDPRRDGLWLEDLGSTNGTFVNGGRGRRRRSRADGASSR